MGVQAGAGTAGVLRTPNAPRAADKASLSRGLLAQGQAQQTSTCG